MDWIKLIDSGIYIVLLLALYLVVKKHFVRSNILWLLLPVSLVDVVDNYFDFNLLASLCDALVVSMIVAVVI